MKNMIIGQGQLARKFKENQNIENTLVFASGVANSKCTDEDKFDREKTLLLKHLDRIKGSGIKFVYFSSCALSVENYELNRYYLHKQEMENLIKLNTSNYYIFRIPQLFGELKKHSTLINYLYNAIREHKKIRIYSKAYRYVIELNDLYSLVNISLEKLPPGQIFDIANPYRYSVTRIVDILEKLTKQKANYSILEKEDGYILNFDIMNSLLDENDNNLGFGRDYLYKNLKKKVKCEEV